MIQRRTSVSRDLQASESLVVNADGGDEIEALLQIPVVVRLHGVVVGLHLVSDHPDNLAVGRWVHHGADYFLRIRTLWNSVDRK